MPTHTKVDWNEDGSCWAEIRAGRKRYFGKDHVITKRLRENLTLDGLSINQRANASGTHEPMVYFRDSEGKINIPPDPSLVPKNCERLEVRTLREADALAKEMTAVLQESWSHDAEVTAQLDMMAVDENGRTPRQIVADEHNRPISDYGREVTAEMLRALDREEADRQRVSANVFFNWRENG